MIAVRTLAATVSNSGSWRGGTGRCPRVSGAAVASAGPPDFDGSTPRSEAHRVNRQIPVGVAREIYSTRPRRRIHVVGMLVGLLLAAAPLAGDAQVRDGLTLTPTEVRDQFAGCGYATVSPAMLAQSRIQTAPWLTDWSQGADVSTLFVRDAGELDRWDGRALLVIVFTEPAQALAAYQRGASGGPPSDSTPSTNVASADLEARTFTENRGPALAPGYGSSVWRHNVALTQLLALPPNKFLLEIATELRGHGHRLDDASDDDLEAARSAVFGRMAPRAREDLRASTFGVDRDFVACLEAA